MTIHIIQAFLTEHWGDIASVLGLVVASIAAWMATSAKVAAEKAQSLLTELDALSALREAATLLEEAKALHRNDGWEAALYRYSRSRRLIIEVRYGCSAWSEPHQQIFTSAVAQLRSMEKQVDSYLRKDDTRTPSSERLNDVLSGEIDALGELEGYLRGKAADKGR